MGLSRYFPPLRLPMPTALRVAQSPTYRHICMLVGEVAVSGETRQLPLYTPRGGARGLLIKPVTHEAPAVLRFDTGVARLDAADNLSVHPWSSQARCVSEDGTGSGSSEGRITTRAGSVQPGAPSPITTNSAALLSRLWVRSLGREKRYQIDQFFFFFLEG